MKFWNKILFEKSLNKIKNESIKNYFLTFFSIKKILIKVIVFLMMTLILSTISFLARDFALNEKNGWECVFNEGVAFSIGSNLGGSLIVTIQAVPIVISFIAYIFINNVYLYIPLSLIFIGGSCNLIDRYISDNGNAYTVVDYIPTATSVFNFPDIIIVSGCIIFAISCLIYLIIVSTRDSRKDERIVNSRRGGYYIEIDENKMKNSKKINNIYLVVKQSDSLLNYLVQNTNYNQKQIKRFFLENKIYINDNLVNNINLLLNVNDSISLKISENNIEKIVPKDFEEIEILYEDEYLLIINKPNNLLTHKTKFNENDTLQDYLNGKYSFLQDVERSGITHRLDRDTTGILVIAKNNNVFKQIQKSFEENDVIRKYQAIVLNHFKGEYYEIDTMIGHSHNDALKMTTNNPKNPKRAITLVKVLDYLSEKHCLVECELKTGRTHQIRVHMNYINHPILNDPLYGTKLNDDDYNQYLHCTYVKFTHPILFKNIEVTCKLPEQFLNKIEEIKNEK